MSVDALKWILWFALVVAIFGEIENILDRCTLDRCTQTEIERRRDGGPTVVDGVFDAIERKQCDK